MRILALSKYSELGASSRLRVLQYLDYLREHGNEVFVAPLLLNEYVERLYAGQKKQWAHLFLSYVKRIQHISGAYGTFDLIWLEKELFPWLPTLIERLFEDSRIPYVVDYDDAIFHNYDRHRASVIRYLLGRKIDSVMRRARCVVVGNEYLAIRARQAGARNVEYLPTAVDLARYKVVPFPSRGIFTIGWIGTPLTAAQNLPMVVPALKAILQRIPSELVTIGSGSIDLGIPIRPLVWREDTEVDMIQQFDVGIMPLINEPFQRGKCAYKLIQCMAAGRPVIGSPVGVNSQVIRPGTNGFLAESMDDWTKALMALYQDFALRCRMGTEARKTVESEYCTGITAPRLLTILKNAHTASSFPSGILLRTERQQTPRTDLT